MGITLVLRGAIREVACGREEIATALSVVVKPAGVAHADEIGPSGAQTLQVLFDPQDAHPLLGERNGLEQWSWMHGRSVAATMLAVLGMLRRPRSIEPGELQAGVLDILGAVAEPSRADGAPPQWIARIKEMLDEGVRHSLSVESLAREAGTHAVSVSRAFRRHFGCTITEYRRRERLRRAAATIAESRRAVSQVAHAAGYADHAHLCREFRSLTGLTPSSYRALVRAHD